MKYVQKADLKKIRIEDFSNSLPELKNITVPKATAIAKWLMSKIDNDKNIKSNMLLPSKGELAYLLGVSSGTVQNALRYIEDMGYVESKQCIGTIIKDRSSENLLRKLTSKRETAVNAIKKYLKSKSFKIGDSLPSARNISFKIGCSANTTRLALEFLSSIGILAHNQKNLKESGWTVNSLEFDVKDFESENVTLVKKVESDLKKYINDNLKVGDRIPAHGTLSKELSVSIKTIHDALKMLIDEGILLSRRGRYGTVVLKMPDSKIASASKETSIFASAPEAAFYYYEKTQNHIKKMIAEKYEVGSKLPSIVELSKELDLSPNTIRKAFHNLAKEGYLAFSRGRYGGTFVIDIPDEQTFKWLSVNPKYAKVKIDDNILQF